MNLGVQQAPQAVCSECLSVQVRCAYGKTAGHQVGVLQSEDIKCVHLWSHWTGQHEQLRGGSGGVAPVTRGMAECGDGSHFPAEEAQEGEDSGKENTGGSFKNISCGGEGDGAVAGGYSGQVVSMEVSRTMLFSMTATSHISNTQQPHVARVGQLDSTEKVPWHLQLAGRVGREGC